jgi:alkylhydroperoxidase/carboxymuconolactone decarboxylase family protein YurZ
MATANPNLPAASQAAGLDPKKSADAIAAHAATYTSLLGFLPPRIEARLTFTGALDRDMVDLQERMRSHAMDTPHLDQKTVQLMLFGMLLMDGNDAAETHAIASRREGASWDELQAVISLCFLFRGLPAANRGADILARVATRLAPADGAKA